MVDLAVDHLVGKEMLPSCKKDFVRGALLTKHTHQCEATIEEDRKHQKKAEVAWTRHSIVDYCVISDLFLTG